VDNQLPDVTVTETRTVPMAMVALFSACPHPITFDYMARQYWVLPGITDVPEAAALFAVGPQNTGGYISRRGVRRLFEDDAVRNAKAQAEAARDSAMFLEKHGAPLKMVEKAKGDAQAAEEAVAAVEASVARAASMEITAEEPAASPAPSPAPNV
jgi:hypothetical protein